MKIILVSCTDLDGGGARAASRLHKAFRCHSIESTMLVAEKLGDDHFTIGTDSSKVGRAFRMLGHQINDSVNLLQKNIDDSPRALNLTPGPLYRRIQSIDASVVNLHWINADALSIAQIGRINKPVVFTLHDMWAFSGAEHYCDDSANSRFRRGYLADNRPNGSRWIDLDRWTWNRKRKHWRTPHYVICPSGWMASCAQTSALMGDWPIRIVPNTLDVDRFQPLEKAFCRKALGLPQEPNLIAFGAIGGSQDPRKGFDLLFSAISCLSSNKLDRQTQCIIFGQSEPIDPPRLGIPMTYLGHLGDDYTLALVYSAADVVVVPSRQDNLPQTATEAHSCGRPVVAFDVGGMSDVVDDRVTGYLAKPFEPGDLAKGICWTIQDGDRLANLGQEARKRALSLWVPETIVKQYLGVYEEATDAARGIK